MSAGALFHGVNAGSNPAGNAKSFNNFTIGRGIEGCSDIKAT
jgi:hypothetical protein